MYGRGGNVSSRRPAIRMLARPSQEKIFEAFAPAVDGLRYAARGFRIVALDALANTLKVIGCR